jgi:antirestriction protein
MKQAKLKYDKEIEKRIKKSPLSRDIIEAYFDCIGIPKLEYVKEAEDSFYGCFESEKEFAENYINDLGLADCLPCWLYSCIDWQDVFSELRHDFFYTKKDDKLYVFRHL